MDIYQAIQSKQERIKQSVSVGFNKGQKYIAKWMKNGKWQYKYEHLMGTGSASQEIDENLTDKRVQQRQLQAAETLADMQNEMSKIKKEYDQVVDDLNVVKHDLKSVLQIDNNKHSILSYRIEKQARSLEKTRRELVDHYNYIKEQYNKLRGSYGRQ